MTTKFFLYTKKDGYSVQDITGCQIINPASYAGTILLYPEESIDIHYNNAILEGSLIEWCKEFCGPDGVFVDIGAHTGSYAVSLSPKCESVYAFEPHERNYYALCGSVALSNRQNIHCYHLGLGSPEQVGMKVLYIKNEDGSTSTIVKPDEFIRQETVEFTTLDIFFNNNPLTGPIKLIKIDVENNELNVLKGAVTTLEQNGYPKLVFEKHSDENENQKLLDFVRNNLGYHVQPISGYGHMYLASR
jgi:FkbM family methyltransferase